MVMTTTPTPATQEARPGWLRDVALFMSGQTMSMFGSGVVGYAVIWYITLETGSGGQYALLMIASQMAMALTSIPGGIWADRYWRKALIIGADAVVAVVTIGLALLMLNGMQTIWLIAAALALRGLAGGIQAPAAMAALPQIAPTQHLMRVNSINMALQAVIQVAAPALAAVLIVWWPLGWILMVDVTTAVIGIVITLFVRIPRLSADPTARPEGFVGYVRHLGEAYRYGWAIPGLRRSLAMFAILMTVVVPYSMLTPVFVVRLYGPEEWMLAVVEITWSLGMLVGGIVMAAWGGTRNRMTAIMISCLVMTAATAVMGFMPNIWWFVVIMVVTGMTMPMMNTPLTTAVQELIPEAMMGRVMSIMMIISTVCGPLGMAVIGPLADVLDLRWMALACGAAGLVYLIGLAVAGGPGSKLYPPQVASEGAETAEKAAAVTPSTS